jgi:hypothetical protein
MKTVVTALLVVGLTGGFAGQEKEVPKDSMRISIPGCARGAAFTVVESPEHESRTIVEPGRRFRLAGPKAVMKEIKEREGKVIEVTGLVRKGQIDQRGVAVGGRVRIGPGPDPGSVGKTPYFDQVVLDVEGWRPLSGECPRR